MTAAAVAVAGRQRVMPLVKWMEWNDWNHKEWPIVAQGRHHPSASESVAADDVELEESEDIALNHSRRRERRW